MLKFDYRYSNFLPGVCLSFFFFGVLNELFKFINNDLGLGISENEIGSDMDCNNLSKENWIII